MRKCVCVCVRACVRECVRVRVEYERCECVRLLVECERIQKLGNMRIDIRMVIYKDIDIYMKFWAVRYRSLKAKYCECGEGERIKQRQRKRRKGRECVTSTIISSLNALAEVLKLSLQACDARICITLQGCQGTRLLIRERESFDLFASLSRLKDPVLPRTIQTIRPRPERCGSSGQWI
jgi:hypothetical protein